ncbi:Hypothetical predicted protein [Olea europaea subsp. europaea]|uniref:DUF4378 domain-containing protein n=2 Tax=Olea europaea subsp. europaea TaxID=158383 RepID=A0A8S0PSR2_OLEEU|nr:Hypothetical predicted protein [Olea europaea subsp. europaea]
MDVEKKGLKGGFFQLFDWNVKSRKKLFSGRSELPESSKQGKENVNGSAISRLQQVNGLENEFGPNARRHIDYHYSSSTSGDTDCGTKAPGVVARLMGLDSLPTSNVSDPYSTPFIESHSFRDSRYLGTPVFQNEHDTVIFDNIRNKVDGFTRIPVDPSLQKLHSRPIERFQSEVLPPKTAKPISITQHRLLSPIKSPGFIPPKNAAYIMEAAAKIIEQNPRSTPKGKSLGLGSSSVPLRIQGLKEKMEAAQRSTPMAVASQKVKEPNSVKNIKKLLSGRGQDRSEDAHSIKGSGESKRVGSQKLKSKEKSVVQANGNIQKKEELIQVGNGSSEKQKEHNEIKSNFVGRNQSNAPKRMEKRSSLSRPSDVLRQNHQKQNCVSNRVEGNYKPSVSQQKDRKDLPTNYINGRGSKTVSKIVVNNVVPSRKTNSVTTDAGKEFSSSRVNTPVKKKQPINRNIQSDRALAESILMAKDERLVKCNVSVEGNTKWDAFDRNNGLDVVSFTFTSPIKKSGAASSSSSKMLEVTKSSSPISNPSDHQSDFKNSDASSLASNIIGRDALSVILEHKLKELTSRVEMSQQELLEASSFSSIANSYQNTGPTIKLVNPTEKDDLNEGKWESQNNFDSPFVDKLWLKEVKEHQGLLDKQEYSNNNNTEHESYLNISRSSPASSLEPSISGASCDSLDGDRTFTNDGGMRCFSVESDEVTDWSSARKPHPIEGDLELSDTASSLSVGTISRTISSTLFPSTNLKESSPWQLQYIRDMLSCSAELMLQEFALGQARKIVPPDLFDQLENQNMELTKNKEEFFMLERKVVFDCACECLELRGRQLFAGSRKTWSKQTMLFLRKEWLAEELYREISSWRNMDELLVDEVVDKDMSTKDGRWVEFEIEAFEEGVEIENRILTSLVDELIGDFLF